MLPGIRQYARMALRHLNPDAREESIQEVVATALVAYVGLNGLS